VAQWRAGSLRPLCVFDSKRMPYKTKITKTMSWSYDIPTCKDTGLDGRVLMLRGIFMPGGVSAEQVAYYVDLLKKVRETPDWKSFLETGSVQPDHLSGKEYEDWVALRGGAAHSPSHSPPRRIQPAIIGRAREISPPPAGTSVSPGIRFAH